MSISRRKKQVDFIRTYFLYHITDFLIFQPADGKLFVLLAHCIEYHVAYAFLKLINVIKENPDITGDDSFSTPAHHIHLPMLL